MIELQLCELYGCLPSALAAEDPIKLLRHLAVRAGENEARNLGRQAGLPWLG